MSLLRACQLAYRKHHLGDESIGWDELAMHLKDALCNEMGDNGFISWLDSQQADRPDVSIDANQKRWKPKDFRDGPRPRRSS